MNETIIFTIVTLCAIGVLAAIILYIVAQKFKVEEDPRIDIVESMMPGANCGGCGFPGCRKFAKTFVESDDVSKMFCPVGGNDTMSKIAEVVGKKIEAQKPKVAVIRCNGSCENAPRINKFDGAQSCRIAAATYGGEKACSFGCLGLGDCTKVCKFGAIKINETTHLPEVDSEKCTACGACANICPRGIIELRPKNKKDMKVFVSCMNKDKGVVARKACTQACIGCQKCVKECPQQAITVENFLAYIDPEKCKLCRKCVAVCPQGAIKETNFPPRKVVTDVPKNETNTPTTNEQNNSENN